MFWAKWRSALRTVARVGCVTQTPFHPQKCIYKKALAAFGGTAMAVKILLQFPVSSKGISGLGVEWVQYLSFYCFLFRANFQ
jgi:hypothetical protein